MSHTLNGLLHLDDGSTVNLQIIRNLWLNSDLTYQRVEVSAAPL
jgi:membrane carboxypeptidase/penicillin-binding protein